MIDDLERAQAALDVDQASLHARQAEIASERHRRLEAEHQELVTQCRTAQQEVSRLRFETDAAQRASVRANGVAENARQHTADHRAVRPAASSYPSAAELAKWQSDLERLQGEAAGAERAYSEASATYHCERVRWERARDEFSVLADREQTLRSELHPPRRSLFTLESSDVHTTQIVRTA